MGFFFESISSKHEGREDAFSFFTDHILQIEACKKEEEADS